MDQHTPLKDHFKDTYFWFDILGLSTLWIVSFLVPSDLKLGNLISISDFLKIMAIIGSIETIGFFSYHLLGRKAGLLAKGFLGGFISSTLTFISMVGDDANKHYHPKTISLALLLANVAMQIECILIVLLMSTNKLILTVPFILQIFTLIFIIFLNRKFKDTEPKIKNEVSVKSLEEPIIWKKVFYFGAFIILLIFSMKFIKNSLNLPYNLAALIISFFEAHGVLIAGLTEFQSIDQLNAAMDIMLIVMFGNVISKSMLMIKSQIPKIRTFILSSLGLSLVPPVIFYLFFNRYL